MHFETVKYAVQRVEVVAIIEGDQHFAAFGRTDPNEEGVQRIDEFVVRERTRASLEQRVNDRAHEVRRCRGQRIALRIGREPTAVADKCQRNELGGQDVGKFGVDEEDQEMASKCDCAARGWQVAIDQQVDGPARIPLKER